MTINFAFVAMDHIVNEAAKLHYMFAGQFRAAAGASARWAAAGASLGATHSQTPDVDLCPFPGLESGRAGHPGGCQRAA